MTDIVHSEPLSAQYLNFITAYVNCLDLEKAAVESGLQPEMGKVLYKRPRVREEIDKRLAAINGTVNHTIAQRRILSVEELDTNLRQVIKLTKKQILSAPPLARAKVDAIELGYKRVGLLIDGDFIPDGGSAAAAAPKGDEAPRIFRGDGRTILTHEISEKKTITTTQEVAPPPPQPVLKPVAPVVDGEKDPWENF